jgi:hypothetical protein
MKEKNLETIKTGMKIGAVLGGIVFLFFGIVPGFHYGGFAAVMLLSKLTGGAVEFTLLARAIVVFGVLLGILCIGTLSIVLGSVIGTLSGYVVAALSSLKAHDVKEEMLHNR